MARGGEDRHYDDEFSICKRFASNYINLIQEKRRLLVSKYLNTAMKVSSFASVFYIFKESKAKLLWLGIEPSLMVGTQISEFCRKLGNEI